MDFTNRSAQTQATYSAGQTAASGNSGKRSRGDKTKLSRIAVIAAIVAIVVLLIGVIASVSFGGAKSESKYVDSNKLQAVFLNTGQVYFGNIKSLNKDYVVLSNIYYLQTANANGGNTNTNVSLVKLGCELHEPYDQMLINSDQVTFWENLQDNGQVAKAVATFEKQNPEGQKCADQSSSASSNSSNSAQNAGSSSTPAANTNKSTTTNP